MEKNTSKGIDRSLRVQGELRLLDTVYFSNCVFKAVIQLVLRRRRINACSALYDCGIVDGVPVVHAKRDVSERKFLGMDI